MTLDSRCPGDAHDTAHHAGWHPPPDLVGTDGRRRRRSTGRCCFRCRGLGLIGGGYVDPDWLSRELAVAGESRVGVGFITFALDRRPGALRLALDAHPPAIQLSFGDPRPYAEDIHNSGALLICQFQTSEEIVLAVAAGADAIIAQGQDAGGHGRCDRGTMGLVPSVVDMVAPLPVVAAGGIVDGRGLAAALMLGATGIAMGTRFLASTATLSNPAEAAALVAARSHDTVRPRCSMSSGVQHGPSATTGGWSVTVSPRSGVIIATWLTPSACSWPPRPTTTPFDHCGPAKASTTSTASNHPHRSCWA